MTVKGGKKLKILYAEDNKINQRIIQVFINKIGHLCDIAQNGREAIDMHAKINYDCILMDIQMPVMDGLEATQEIRKLEKNKPRRVPIIAVTASSPYDEQKFFREMGMDYYIPKPVSMETMRALLNKIATEN